MIRRLNVWVLEGYKYIIFPYPYVSERSEPATPYTSGIE